MSWLVRIPPMGKMKTDFSVPIFWDCVDTCLQTCTNRCTRISCMANYTCDDNNLNPDLSYRVPEVVWDQWDSSGRSGAGCVGRNSIGSRVSVTYHIHFVMQRDARHRAS